MRKFILMLLLCLPLVGSTISFDMDYAFSGDGPAGAIPWAKVTFSQTAADTVEVNMQSYLTLDQFISGWYFNVDPMIDLSEMTTTPDSGSLADAISIGQNSYRADGDGYYDVLFSFPTAMSGRFMTGNSIYSLTAPGLTPASFQFGSEYSGVGSFLSAIHVQNIPSSSVGGWVAGSISDVPEPGTLMMVVLGVGLISVAKAMRRWS